MRLCSFLDPAGRPRLGTVTGSGIHDVTDQVPGGDGLSPMRRMLSHGMDATVLETDTKPAAVAQLLPPVPDPSKVIAAPVNYVDHQIEMTQDVHIDGLGVFLKAPSSLVASGGVVRLPYTDRRIDQEGELAVVIGTRASHVALDAALDHLAGVTCLMDMTMRGGEDRSVRKSFDTFTPMGPDLVTLDEVGPLEQQWLRTWVGSDLRQRVQFSDLIWDVPAIVSYVSSVMVLEPGDVIATGTPAGVGQIVDGDEVTVEITNIGRLTVTVTNDGATTCPTTGRDRGPKAPPSPEPIRE